MVGVLENSLLMSTTCSIQIIDTDGLTIALYQGHLYSLG